MPPDQPLDAMETMMRMCAIGLGALYEVKALPGDYLGELFDAVPKDTTQQARFGREVRYGLGVTIRATPLGTAYGHRGYLSIFEYYPVHEVAVAMQVNALGPYDLAAYAVHLAQSSIEPIPK